MLKPTRLRSAPTPTAPVRSRLSLEIISGLMLPTERSDLLDGDGVVGPMTGVLGHFVAALVPAALAACVYMNALEGSLVCAPTAAGQRASDLANSFQSVARIATTTAQRCGTIPTCGEIRRWAKFGYTTTGAVISRTIRVTNRTSHCFART